MQSDASSVKSDEKEKPIEEVCITTLSAVNSSESEADGEG